MARRIVVYGSELYHHGIKGQKWGVRRYQNEDGTLTDAGKKRYRYNSEDGSIKYVRYPKSQLGVILLSDKIRKENEARWTAADKTFAKDVTDELSKYGTDKDSQRTYLETLSQNQPWKMAEIRSRFVRPGQFDDGEKLEEKRALSKLSDESVKRYNDCCKANVKLSKRYHELYKEYRVKNPDDRFGINSDKWIVKDPKYQDFLKKSLVAEVKLVNSQMQNLGLHSDDYSACLILGSYYKNRYDNFRK